MLSTFFQLILSLGIHMGLPYMAEASYWRVTALLAIVVGTLGAGFEALFNSWIRGESISLRNALAVDQIAKEGGGEAWGEAEGERSRDLPCYPVISRELNDLPCSPVI